MGSGRGKFLLGIIIVALILAFIWSLQDVYPLLNDLIKGLINILEPI